MEKKAVLLTSILLLMGAIGTTTLFLYNPYGPYNPYNPPILDDTGSTPEGIAEVVNAMNQFAIDLYLNLTETNEGNLFFSPFSIFSALAMTYEGALNTTQAEMKTLLNLPPDEILHPNYAAVYNSINNKKEEYTLRTGNALWTQEAFPFNESYINRVEAFYGGKAANLDFVNDAENSRQIINQFIENQTNGKIKEIIPQGILDEWTRLVLTNAIYFQGDWKWKFPQSATEDEKFWISPDETISTPMMKLEPKEEMSFEYAEIEDFQVLKLPYKGDEVSMLILLPEDPLELNESLLTYENIYEIQNSLKLTALNEIVLPKFELDTNYNMGNMLSDMGIPSAFTSAANFSGMTNAVNLSIGAVIHQGYIKVDESGTEAAATTVVVISRLAVVQPKSFIADHPFIFVIQDEATQNILFMGRVCNPGE